MVKYFREVSVRAKINRLEHALKVMVKLTPHERKKHFKMTDWGEQTECGTVACLAGHCGLDPWFRRNGFRMNFDRSPYWPNFPDAEPEDYFGGDVAQAIFYKKGNYMHIKKLVQKTIKNLKTRGTVN